MEYFTTNCYTGIVGTFVCFLHFFLLPTYKIADIIEETTRVNIDIPTEIASVTHVEVFGFIGSGM